MPLIIVQMTIVRKAQFAQLITMTPEASHANAPQVKQETTAKKLIIVPQTSVPPVRHAKMVPQRTHASVHQARHQNSVTRLIIVQKIIVRPDRRVRMVQRDSHANASPVSQEKYVQTRLHRLILVQRTSARKAQFV